MTDPVAAKLLDDVICLLWFPKLLSELDFNTIEPALCYIATAHKEHRIPITIAMADELRRRGLLHFVITIPASGWAETETGG